MLVLPALAAPKKRGGTVEKNIFACSSLVQNSSLLGLHLPLKHSPSLKYSARVNKYTSRGTDARSAIGSYLALKDTNRSPSQPAM